MAKPKYNTGVLMNTVVNVILKRRPERVTGYMIMAWTGCNSTQAYFIRTRLIEDGVLMEDGSVNPVWLLSQEGEKKDG